MKICVFGAGGVGGHVAALLAHAGADVSVVARGAHLQAIRDHGLTLRTDDGEIQAKVAASNDTKDLGVQDFVIVTVKAPALTEVAQSLAPLLGPDTAVAFAMNGIPWWYFHAHGGAHEGKRLPRIDPGDIMWNAVGPQRVIGAVVSSACEVIAPGIVEVKGGNRPMAIGNPDGSITPRLECLAAWLTRACIPVECTVDIRDRIWSKLILNLGSGPMSALAPVTLRELYAEPACVDARRRILSEAIAIAEAMGRKVAIDWDRQLDFARDSRHRVSIGQDFDLHRQPEIAAMLIAPLDMARMVGVETPTLDILVALATLKAKALGIYQERLPGTPS